MADTYRSSLKHPDAEEVLDLVLFRPLAWLAVLALRRTPVTPNQVTGLSLAATLGAAWCFASGEMALLAAGAGLYALGNVLDCADGQLARVQGSGTPNGRLIDGLADYIGTVAVFLGIGIGYSARGWNLWPETVFAGAASALHAMIFDHLQAAFIAAARAREAGPGVGGAGGGLRTLDAGPSEGKRATEAGRLPGGETPSPVSGGVLQSLRHRYERVQAGLIRSLFPGAPGGSAAPDPDMMRLWSFLGPTTNRTALIAFALLGRPDLYLWAVIVPGNLWLAALLFLRRQVAARRDGGAKE